MIQCLDQGLYVAGLFTSAGNTRANYVAGFDGTNWFPLNGGLMGSGAAGTPAFEVGQRLSPGAVLAKIAQPWKLKAELKIAETQAKDIALGQEASIDTRNGLVEGRVLRIDPAVQNGTVTVDASLDGALDTQSLVPEPNADAAGNVRAMPTAQPSVVISRDSPKMSAASAFDPYPSVFRTAYSPILSLVVMAIVLVTTARMMKMTR